MTDLVYEIGLPPAVLQQGRSLAEFSMATVVWPRDAALEVLTIIGSMHDRPIAVLGGDVWDMTTPTPRPAYSNWHSDPTPSEPFRSFARRTLGEAEAYISGYPRSLPKHWFSLVLVERLPGTSAAG